jgi:hypothetical protein
MARNFEGTTFSRLPGHYTRLIKAKVTKSVLWEIMGPYSLGSNDRNGLVHILTERCVGGFGTRNRTDRDRDLHRRRITHDRESRLGARKATGFSAQCLLQRIHRGSAGAPAGIGGRSGHPLRDPDWR